VPLPRSRVHEVGRRLTVEMVVREKWKMKMGGGKSKENQETSGLSGCS
jgi:hypothetical protein